MALVKYRCPSCADKFSVEMGKEPRFCPLCGYDTAEDEERKDERLLHMLAVQQPPSVRTYKGTVPDQVYRDMENASIHRMEKAAEAADCDVSDLSAMKITNMSDTAKEGEASHMMVPPSMPSIQAAPVPNQQLGFNSGAAMAAEATKTRHGPNAGAGGRTLGILQNRIMGGNA